MSATRQHPGSLMEEPLLEGRTQGTAECLATTTRVIGINQIEPQPVTAPRGVPTDKVPRHIAIICDGNARWAQARGLSIAEGHEQGAALLVPIAEAVAEWGIAAVTSFILSTENLKREEKELQYLYALLARRFMLDLPTILKLGIKVQVMGQRHLLPPAVQKVLSNLEEATAHNNRLLWHLAIGYGGQQDIVLAAQQLARKVQQGLLQPEQITEALLSQHLASAAAGAPDLIIRTSGEQRISNFMLWEAAYTELYFSDKMWPDFDRLELQRVLQQYATRERRFGARHFTCENGDNVSSPVVLESASARAESEAASTVTGAGC